MLGGNWWRNHLHAHSFFETCHVYSGCGTFRINGTRHRIARGDTFMAWLLRSVVVDHGVSIPVEPAAVTTMLELAAKAAAINCSRAGCVPPTAAEVLG